MKVDRLLLFLERKLALYGPERRTAYKVALSGKRHHRLCRSSRRFMTHAVDSILKAMHR